MKQLFMGEAFGRGCHVSKWVTAGVIAACLALIAPAAARKLEARQVREEEGEEVAVEENLEIVRAAMDALNRGDMDAVLKDAAPDFEFDFSRAVGPTHGVFGRDDLPGLFRGHGVDDPRRSDHTPVLLSKA